MLLEYRSQARTSHKMMTIMYFSLFFWCINIAEDSITHTSKNIRLLSSFSQQIHDLPKIWDVEIAPIIGNKSFFFLFCTGIITRTVKRIVCQQNETNYVCSFCNVTKYICFFGPWFSQLQKRIGRTQNAIRLTFFIIRFGSVWDSFGYYEVSKVSLLESWKSCAF